MYDYMKDARYKAIVKEYVEAMEHKEKQLKRDVKPERIKKEADEALKSISEKMKEFHETRLKEIEENKRAIVKAYKQRGKQYEDPQAEILKRQDFDTEIAVATDMELEDIARDTDRELSKYELNKLQLEFKERDIRSIELIRQRMDTKQAHETDPNYQRLDTEEIQLMHFKPKMRASDNWILLPNTEEGERPKFNSLGELAKPMINIDMEELRTGYKKLERNISSEGAYKASFNPVIKSEAESYADELIKTGRTDKLKQYADDDLRAIEGSSQYDVTHKFKYLKERYHDPSNEIYSIENPNYSVHDHYEYLKKQHEKDLQAKPELQKQIKEVLTEDQTKQKEKEASKPREEVEQVAE